MLDTSASALWTEVQASERLVKSHLDSSKAQVERYHGGSWKGLGSTYEDTPENHYFEWVALMVPRMVAGNPRVRVATRRPGSQSEVAQAVQFGLNRWSRDTTMRRLLEKGAVDFAFNWAVFLTSVEARPGQKEVDDPDQWPSVTRIPPDRYGWDSVATSIEEARFQYHMVIRDREDIKAEAREDPDSGWNIEMLDSLAKDAGTERMYRNAQTDVERDEVVYYEVWIPEITLDDSEGPDAGYHGTIFTLGVGVDAVDERKAEFIRDPRPYFGPRWGPYTLVGAYTVPNEVAPLSPLAAVESQIDDVNMHARAISNAAARYKKLGLVDATDTELHDAIASAKDATLVPLSGIDRSKFVETEIGGASPVQVSYLEYIRDRLDRNAGLGDAQRGAVEGGATATEQSIASEASQTRMGFPIQKFEDGTQRIFKTVAWFLYMMEDIKFPLGPEVAEQLNMGPQLVVGPDGLPKMVPAEPWFQGGHTDEEGSGASFDDLELEIEPYSMRRTSEAQDQQRAAFMLEIGAMYAPTIPMTPWVDHRRILREAGAARGINDLADIIKWELVPDLPPEMLLDAPQPRFSVDAGRAGVYGRGNAPKKTGLEGNTAGAIAAGPTVGEGKR